MTKILSHHSISLRNKPVSELSVPCQTALAPMQDVTGLPFMSVIARRGAPDFFFTEFFRVHQNSRLSPEILSSITRNPSSSPIFAQIIGENLMDVQRTIKDLKKYPIAGVDLNLGCPAPRVYKKNVGGGLLRDPDKIDKLLRLMRECLEGNLTVKMRIGFEDDRNFSEILSLIVKNKVNLLSLHVRTVKGGYKTPPQYDYVKKAVEYFGDRCPVLANGSIETAEDAVFLRKKLGTFGVMIGRGAIRNPWIFRQIRELEDGIPVFRPVREDIYDYCIELYKVLERPQLEERKMVSRIKKFLNFIGSSIPGDSGFLNGMRRSSTKGELFGVFEKYLTGNGLGELPVSFRPLFNS